MQFYLSGQTTFGNRGCEALVRGTAAMLQERLGDVQLMCPLDNPAAEARQWPQAAGQGVRFMPSPVFPATALRWWARANRLLPLARMGFPRFAADAGTRAAFEQSAALIMTGGDILTLDYGVMSLYQWCRLNEAAMESGVPAVLWAASVGPFSARPEVERVMAAHLRRYAAITVRETVSLEYLRSIGVEHAELVADPAFHLGVETFDTSALDFGGSRPLLGFNVSPLIRLFRGGKASAEAMDREIVAFLRKVTQASEFGVVLIPHVGPLDGGDNNSDWHYMQGLLRHLDDCRERIVLAPPDLNAAQLKYLIGLCRYFIGARTHSTIAALSQGVPTVSIAYSTKAKGINKDLFGHLRYVLETPRVTAETLDEALVCLQNEEADMRALLAERLPEWRSRAMGSVDALLRVARNSRQ